MNKICIIENKKSAKVFIICNNIDQKLAQVERLDIRCIMEKALVANTSKSILVLIQIMGPHLGVAAYADLTK